MSQFQALLSAMQVPLENLILKQSHMDKSLVEFVSREDPVPHESKRHKLGAVELEE